MEFPSRFAHKNWADTSYMFNFFKGRLAARFDHEVTQVFQATDATGELVALACWTHEPASAGVDPTPTGTIVRKMPPTVNVDFIKTVGAEIEQLRELMKGEDRPCLHDFALQPSVSRSRMKPQISLRSPSA